MFLGLSALQTYIVFVGIFIIVYLITPRNKIWIPFLVLTVLFTVLAYHLVPESTDDMNLYFHHIDIMRRDGIDGLNYAINENWYEWQTYRVGAYYFYLISLLPNNHYLPAVTMCIVYALASYVLVKAANRFNVQKSYLFFAALFFISTYWYYDTASGIRNGLAFSIAFACSYQFMVERKNIVLCIVGFLCATLMHSAGITPVVLALVAALTLNFSGKFINIVLIFGFAAGNYLISYLSEISDNSLIQSLAGKAEGHQLNFFAETGTMYKVNVVVLAIIVLLMLYFSSYIFYEQSNDDLKRFYKYISIIVYFCIGCVFSQLLFVRFARWILPQLGALLFMVGMQKQNDAAVSARTEPFQYNAIRRESLLIRIRPLVYIMFVVFTAVHFWYSVNWSSLVWMHFD